MVGNRSRGGRPPIADEDDLRTRAIAVLQRDGYRNVTMSQIAAETGVSVRTLHRYFPGKADIVWGGIEGSLDALRDGLAHADDTLPPLDAITAVVAAVFDQDADEVAVGRARMRLIATEPDLESTRPDTYRQWRAQTVAFFARRLGLPADDVVPQAAGAAVLSTIMSALSWWAVQDDSDISPAAAVTRALRGLSSATRTDPRHE
ncbi:acyl-CoA-like ligand-binding transcription factor [Leifsonia sp. RAF41]|uniref:acyl-CoA-like ligand-binding transcription factor n=1 Tax=Leifsonia sp. RAF41 TaxID=3233056 RepID=UPI003F94DF8A